MKFNFLVSTIIAFLCSFNSAYAEKLSGKFTRGFERYDLLVNNKDTYFVEDPKNLIKNLDINKKSDKSFFTSFPLCIDGKASKQGNYGPNGRYSKKIRVSKICN